MLAVKPLLHRIVKHFDLFACICVFVLGKAAAAAVIGFPFILHAVIFAVNIAVLFKQIVLHKRTASALLPAVVNMLFQAYAHFSVRKIKQQYHAYRNAAHKNYRAYGHSEKAHKRINISCAYRAHA